MVWHGTVWYGMVWHEARPEGPIGPEGPSASCHTMPYHTMPCHTIPYQYYHIRILLYFYLIIYYHLVILLYLWYCLLLIVCCSRSDPASRTLKRFDFVYHFFYFCRLYISRFLNFWCWSQPHLSYPIRIFWASNSNLHISYYIAPP